ncbi:hypothetical protein [Desulfitibacter alkalitolerans]|uniref:hypothetical protein n=1 Tax=Desulfitibacter alkalitolerans TaxID=264641 RepID=UPI00068832E0|nr:hypothetical protein [Desulfitibacter alkalitolerans]
MTLIKQGRFILLASIVLVLSLIMGSFVTGIVNAKDNRMEYKVNESGQTYGSSLYSELHGGEPDLIAAVDEDGVTGYVLKTDLDGPMPKTREEALAMMKMSQASNGHTIPLYAADGKTVLGEFKIGPPMLEEYTKEEFNAKMEKLGITIELPE